MSLRTCQFCGLDYRHESGPRICCETGRDFDIDPVARYYEYVRARQQAAYRRLEDAREAGASEVELSKLRQAAEDAGYTGD